MSQRFSFLLLFLIISSLAYTQDGGKWDLISPLPTDASLDYCYYDDSLILIVGKFYTDGNGYYLSFLNSTDSGNTWSIYENKEIDFWVYYYKSNKLWGIDRIGNIHFSTDKGYSWNLNYSTNDSIRFTYLKFFDSNNAVAVGFISNKIITITTSNGGVNWNKKEIQLNLVESYPYFSFININTGILLKSMHYADSIYRTDDGGVSYNLINANTYPITDIKMIDSLILYFNTYDQGMFLSTDGGFNWSLRSQDGDLFSFSDKNNIYKIVNLSPFYGIYKTTNLGIDWQLVTNLKLEKLFNYFFIENNKMMLVGYNGVIAKSSDSGLNWSYLSKRKFKGNIVDISFSANKIMLGAVEGNPPNTYFYVSSDKGDNWIEFENPSDGYLRKICLIDDNTSFIIFNKLSAPITTIIYRTTNNGTTWRTIEIDSIYVEDVEYGNNILWILASKNRRIVLLFSEDNGLTFKYKDQISIDNRFARDILFTDNMNGYIAISNYPLFKTEDGGISWDTLCGNYSKDFWIHSEIFSLSFINNNTGWMVVRNAADHFFLKTTNGGLTWTSDTLYFDFDYSPVKVRFINQNIGWVTTSSTVDNGPLYKTLDGGISWIQEEKKLKPYLLEFYRGIGFAISDNSVYRYSYNPLTNIDEEKIIISNYNLSQNFPNPFNPNSTIKFSIPIEDMVTIELYNVLGERVKVLYNEYTKAGTKEINLDASELSSGVYLYKMKVGEFISSKKMVLLK